jgi:hypothetical protein
MVIGLEDDPSELPHGKAALMPSTLLFRGPPSSAVLIEWIALFRFVTKIKISEDLLTIAPSVNVGWEEWMGVVSRSNHLSETFAFDVRQNVNFKHVIHDGYQGLGGQDRHQLHATIRADTWAGSSWEREIHVRQRDVEELRVGLPSWVSCFFQFLVPTEKRSVETHQASLHF